MAADDESDVFEITDFTTASDWERFIARLEEILHEWRLVSRQPLTAAVKGAYTNGTWVEKTEDLMFADFKFVATYHCLKIVDSSVENTEDREGSEEEKDEDKEISPTVYSDMMNMENDFPSRAHCLCRWYGLQEFIVVAPGSGFSAIDTESRSKVLMSSVSIALSNTGCMVPMFVQIQQHWRKMYSGMCALPGSTVELDMAHLKKIPSHYNHLAGLLDVFKSKLGAPMYPKPPVSVAVRFTFILQDWNTQWPQLTRDVSSLSESDSGLSTFGSLPFGAFDDPVSELHLSCTWPSLSEEMIVENQYYSDLDPLQAPQWSVRIIMTEDPTCLMGQYIRKFLKLAHSKETTGELLGQSFSEGGDKETSENISHVFQRLTEPSVGYNIPSLSSVMSQATTRLNLKPEDAPLSTKLLNTILLFLFPDVKKIGDQHAEEMETDISLEQESIKDIISDLNKQLKSAPDDSLAHKLAVCFCIVNHNHGGIRAVAHLWQEFVLEMRYRWENNHVITGVEEGPPNLGSCLLHQKIQMLNCCIHRKIRRETNFGYSAESRNVGEDSCSDTQTDSGVYQPSSPQYLPRRQASRTDSIANRISSLDSSSDDEFFDADMSLEESEIIDSETQPDGSDPISKPHSDSIDSSDSSRSFRSPSTHKPVGRLAPFGDLKLLNSEEILYIPVTQEPAPVTEDMLEEQAEVLTKLGSGAEGSHLRARMQSACLLSDMESFKAANPGCSLEDFVRWYSPRDFIGEEKEDENGVKILTGYLSQRMQIPGNMWSEVWQSGRPVPARRQKRLFDDTKEAEKVLHYLSSMKPAHVVMQLMPLLVHSCLGKLAEHEDSDVPKLKVLIEQIRNKAAKVTRSPQPDVKKYEDIVRMINLAETVIARAKSLRCKFTEDLLEQKGAEKELELFVHSLLQHPEVSIRGGPCGPAGGIIHKLFIAQQKALAEFEEQTIDTPPELDDSKPPPDFPKPSAREYILRSVVSRPAPYSKALPQRLYCVLQENDYRLAGAFSEDTLFQ